MGLLDRSVGLRVSMYAMPNKETRKAANHSGRHFLTLSLPLVLYARLSERAVKERRKPGELARLMIEDGLDKKKVA